VPTAVEFVVQRRRVEYEHIFQHLTVPLSRIDDALSDIRVVYVRGNTAEFEMLRTDERRVARSHHDR
jgi:hypothetical protein